jgi:hypothetical protein
VDGRLPNLCPAVALSHQDGRHSTVALVLKAALIHSNLVLVFFNEILFCVGEIKVGGGEDSLFKQTFYGCHHDLVNRYGISVSQMTTDMFLLS